MSNQRRLFNRPPKSLEEKYFSEIRPVLYEHHGTHHQYGVRKGTTLAEHLDSACQFILSVSRIGGVPDDKRPVLLAATAVHDLNKLDPLERKVKDLARDRAFLREQLERACVLSFVSTEDDLELVRRLVERHSGHNVSDGAIFLPEDPAIKRWAAMVTAADLFDLGIPEQKRFQKVQIELTVAFNRPCNLFRVRVSEDRGYITALLLGACEEVLSKHGLTPLAIFPDGELFEGEVLPSGDLATEIATVWQTKIDQVFGNNIEQLIKPLKDGIKISPQAIQHDIETVLTVVEACLEKKKAGFKLDKKFQASISKWGDEKVGSVAVAKATTVGLIPVTNAEEFALSEGLKAAYLSYRKVKPEVPPKQVWDFIARHVGLSENQRIALEPFDSQFGKPLFAAKAITKGIEGIKEAIRESIQMRRGDKHEEQEIEVSEEIFTAVTRTLNLPFTNSLNRICDLSAYIDADPKKRCSLGLASENTKELDSPNMPPGTKVQAFSNRLPGGLGAEPKRQADSIAALAYQLMAVGSHFPRVFSPKDKKLAPFYLHLSLPKGSCPEFLRIWREHLLNLARTGGEDEPIYIDELKLYRDNLVEFKADTKIGLALPLRPEFIQTTVIIPIFWVNVNASVALLKSLRLVLELSLSLEFGFPFTLSGNLEVELSEDTYGRVEGIPAALQPLLGNGCYQSRQDAERILERLRCIGKLAISVASIQKTDDCLYDLARTAARPLDLYYVLLRWTLREQDEPNISVVWSRIREPLQTLLENLMPNDNANLTAYLKEATQIAAEAYLWGSSYKRTAQIEPFAAFITAIRSQKSHMPLDVIFAALVRDYHDRLKRIREHEVKGAKFEQLKRYYSVLRKLYEDVYYARPEKLLADRKTLEAAYLFFLQEAQQQVKSKSKDDSVEITTSI